MENAIWHGQIYAAADIAESYELEKNIRKASGLKELRCPDPGCPSPVLRYCHGEIKSAFFAHLDNCTCDYAEFDKENTQLMRQVKRTLHDSFISRGFDVQIEVKLLPRHYTHLLFTMPDGKKIAVELGTQRTTANRIDYLAEQYKNEGVGVKWIIISNYKTPVKENETFFIKRYLLNESQRNDVLILNWDGTEITQYIVDPNKYIYKGNSLHSDNYPEIYSETSTLADLVFEGEELSIEGFHFRYNEWLTKKKRAFEKKIVQLEEKDRQQEEIKKQQKAELEKRSRDGAKRKGLGVSASVEDNVPIYVTARAAGMSYEARRESILPLMEQQIKQVIDQTGARWVRCELCGAVETVDKFWNFGGANHVNLGKCYKCSKK